MKKFYVAITDYYRSRWLEQSRGMIAKYVVECDTLEQAEQIEKTAKKRYEMKYVKLHKKQPYYSPSRYEVTFIHYNELGYTWTEDKYYSNNREIKKFYVAVTNTDTAHIRVVECDNLQQAEQIEKTAYANPGVKDIAIHFRKPKYNTDNYTVSELQYNKMGKIWTEGKYITREVRL